MRNKIQIGSKIYKFIPRIGLPKDFDLDKKLSDLEVALIPCKVGGLIRLETKRYRITYYPTREKDRHDYEDRIEVRNGPNELRRTKGYVKNGFSVERDNVVGQNNNVLGLLVDLKN